VLFGVSLRARFVFGWPASQGCKGAECLQIPQAYPADDSVFYYHKQHPPGFSDEERRIGNGHQYVARYSLATVHHETTHDLETTHHVVSSRPRRAGPTWLARTVQCQDRHRCIEFGNRGRRDAPGQIYLRWPKCITTYPMARRAGWNQIVCCKSLTYGSRSREVLVAGL